MSNIRRIFVEKKPASMWKPRIYSGICVPIWVCPSWRPAGRHRYDVEDVSDEDFAAARSRSFPSRLGPGCIRRLCLWAKARSLLGWSFYRDSTINGLTAPCSVSSSFPANSGPPCWCQDPGAAGRPECGRRGKDQALLHQPVDSREAAMDSRNLAMQVDTPPDVPVVTGFNTWDEPRWKPSGKKWGRP